MRLRVRNKRDGDKTKRIREREREKAKNSLETSKMHMLHAAYNALVRIVARAYFEILGDPLTTLFVPLLYSAHAHTYM